MALYGNPQVTGIEKTFTEDETNVPKTVLTGEPTYGNRMFYRLGNIDKNGAKTGCFSNRRVANRQATEEASRSVTNIQSATETSVRGSSEISVRVQEINEASALSVQSDVQRTVAKDFLSMVVWTLRCS